MKIFSLYFSILLLYCLPIHSETLPKGKLTDEIITHYTKMGDSEKLRAAKFLLENMRYHTFKDGPKLRQYFDEIGQINNQYPYPECIEQYDKLPQKIGNPYPTMKEISDMDYMDAQSLIDNIDRAFDDWRNGLWAKHLSFDDFCEYLLPYRVGNEKPTEGWRESLRILYMSKAQYIMDSDDMRNSAFWAANKVNDGLHNLGFKNKKVLPILRIELPVSALKNMRMGECFDYATYTTYVMRACGIPVCFDYTPQWPNRSGGHHWNALIDNTGLSMPFMGVESNPGYPSKQGREIAKVYRKTFAYQKQSLFALNCKYKERIPESLNTPFIKDVSDEYFKGHSITIKLNDAHKNDKFAYIAVFNNQQWIPVDFAIINKERTVTFKKLGGDIIYMPVFWGRDGSVPAGDPFLLRRNGSVKVLSGDKNKTQTLYLNRKYPQYNRIIKFRDLLKGGYFEAANKPDFSDAKKCAEIIKVKHIGFDTLTTTNANGEYRYWRYVSLPKSKCNIAEIRFINNAKVMPITKALGEGKTLGNTKPEYAFDGNELTYYNSSPDHAWVGADMGKPVHIDKIAYLSRNDDNDVTMGHTYELCVFDKGVQRAINTQKATSGCLIFKNVPVNAVYILHDLDKGTEERIFTYENDQVNWY